MNVSLEHENGSKNEWIDINEYQLLEAVAKFLICAGDKVGMGDWIFFLLNAAQGKEDYYEFTLNRWTFFISN